MSESDKVALRSLQRIELNMLEIFIGICTELNLDYFLIGGSAIGAVRHHGFIPWDDDIDIGMMRSDYEIFVQYAPGLLPPHLFLQNHDSDNSSYLLYSKLRDSNTTFLEYGQENMCKNHGIFIDIFPFDYVPEKGIGKILFNIKRWFYLERIKAEYRNKKTGNAKIVRSVLNFILKVLLPSPEVAYRKLDSLIKSSPKSCRVRNHGGAWSKEQYPHAWIASTQKSLFEGIDVSIPVGNHQILSYVYGDYMKLPPIEKRVSHHKTSLIDVSKSYKEYIK